MEKTKKIKPLTQDEMAAWCEWRKWCSIWRVEDPLPSPEEIAAGMDNDVPPDVRRQYFNYLSSKVDKAIRYRLEMLAPQRIISANTESHRNLRNETISVFDDYMKGEKPKKNSGFNGVTYKDYVFHLIASGEDFGRVINGKIFSKRGYIRAIVVKYVTDNIQCEIGPRGGISYWDKDTKRQKTGIRLLRSIYEPIGSDEKSSALHDILADKNADPMREKYDLSPLLAMLSTDEKAVIIAYIYKIPMSSPLLLNAINCQKSKTSELKNQLFPPLNPQHYPDSLWAKIINAGFQDDMINDPHFFSTEVKNAIISDLAAEKNFDSFLSALEDNTFRKEEE